MALKRIVHRTGFIGAPISDAATILLVDKPFLDIVAATMDFVAGDYFYMTIEEDDLLEEVKVTSQGSNYLVIERSATPHSFSMAAVYNTDMTAAEVEERAAGLAPVTPISITGAGIADVQDLGGGNFSVTVPQPVLSGDNGIEVTTAFPNYGISIDTASGCCGDGEEGSTGSFVFIGAGIADVDTAGNEVTINVPSPNFTGEGVAITGVWPNLLFAVESIAGGTVTSVGTGAGLSQTGNPNVNPVLYISNTGVVPGTYGGITVNARGQITEMPEVFDPISVLTGDNGIQVNRTGGDAQVVGIDAAVGIKGVVELADADVPIDPDDESTAITPKMLAAVVSDLATTEFMGGATYAGEPDVDYTEVVATAGVTLDLAIGEKAFVIAELTVRETSVSTIPQYAMAVFAAGSGLRMHANKKQEATQQVMHFLVNGPFNDTLLVKTTALGTATVVSHSLHAILS